jgi:hypothetical protein
LYFVFNLFIFKGQIRDLAVFVNSTELSQPTERPIW